MDLLATVFSGFALSLATPLVVRFARRGAGWVLALLPIGLTIYFARHIGHVMTGGTIAVSYSWSPELGISLSFYLDGLSLSFALLICGIGALIVVYAGEYLHNHPDLDRFYVYLLMFMSSMLGLVLADNALTMFVFWELTGIASFLLIGFENERETARSAALQALLVTSAGGLALLAGLLLLSQAGGSSEFSTLLNNGRSINGHPLYFPILLLILIGAFAKSAQFPFHFWLPSAMEAPTPVSAYLHSATMVKAGVYLLARLSSILGGTDAWHYLVTGAGAATMVLGAFMAIWQTDLKLLLAYSTVSTLGTLTLLLGLDTVLSVKAAMLLLVAHALYKGALFLISGIIDHETGTRDVIRLGGLARAMPVTAVSAGFAALSMAGTPPMLGFISKELLYEAKLQVSRVAPLVTGIGVLANILLVAAAGLVGLKPFWGRRPNLPKEPHEAPPSMLAGPIILSGISLLCGLFPETVASIFLSAAVSAVRAQAITVELKLWHGINPVFALSILTLATGILVYAMLDTIRHAKILVAMASRFGPQRVYFLLLSGLNSLASTQTRLLQSGYLRVYVMIIVITIVGLIGCAQRIPDGLAITWEGLSDVRPYEWGILMLILLAALMAVLTPSRLAAAAALSVIGYGIALVYVFFGAPDLAMTQFTVETLAIILFVLVVYKLPRFASLSSRSARIRDALIAILAGGTITSLILITMAHTREPHLAAFFAENSWIQAKGRNVVNVILVDFRALDTLGEIIVLSVAAIGAHALLRPGLEKTSNHNPRGNQALNEPGKLVFSPILFTAVRYLFPLMLLFSVFLLLRGHNEPGGGFVAGLVAAAAFSLYAIIYGAPAARRILGINPSILIGAGLLIALSSGLAGVFSSRPFMTGIWLELTLPILGKIGTPFLFDTGVYLVVIGATLKIILDLTEE